jgi:hypothetical protein
MQQFRSPFLGGKVMCTFAMALTPGGVPGGLSAFRRLRSSRY